MKKTRLVRNKIKKDLDCLLLILCILLCFSCRETFKDELKSINLKNAIDLNGIDLFNRMEVVELGKIDENEMLIGKIHKVLRDGEIFFFLTGELETFKSIIITDSVYKLKAKIERIGNGPGEYSSIRDFTINTDERLIVIHDLQLKKVLRYDYDGNFIDEKNLDFRGERLVYQDGCYFIFTNKYPNKLQIKSELIVTDKEFKTINTFIPHNQEHPFVYLSNIVFTRDYTSNLTYFSNVFRDTIYKISKKNITPILTIKYPNPMPWKFANDLDSYIQFQNDYWFYSGCFFSNGTYYSFEVNENGNRSMYLYDQRVDSLFRIDDFKSDTHKWQFRYPIYCDSSGTYFSVIDAVYLIESRDLWKAKFSHDAILLDFLSNMSLDDNPCILRYKYR